MDDVNIHIDELVLDGAGPVDAAALAAALHEQMGPTVDHEVVCALGDSLARSLSSKSTVTGQHRA